MADTAVTRRDPAPPISISHRFPGGSIATLAASDPLDIRLALVPDEKLSALGWYYFRATGLRGRRARFKLVNAGDCLDQRLAGREDYDNAWLATGAVASYDRRYWFRVPGQLKGQAYIFEHEQQFDSCYYAQWAPYPLDRELDALARWQLSPRVRQEVLGQTVDGADLTLVTIGTAGSDKRTCWIIARQHPSETMGGYFIEGLVDRLLDPQDSLTATLLGRAVFHIVPNMNPDGALRGHTRANAAGANLNREWIDPDPWRSPEVWWVRRRMEVTGVDFAMDCHGDEELRCNFLGGPLEIPSRSPLLTELFHDFETAWAAASPAYQLGHPYPGGAPAEADLSMAWNWIGERFRCLSVLLEQPFKDTGSWPDPLQGWSPERAYAFGRSFPAALAAVIDKVRD
jgi:murein tripeptide amidase MpaA